jgi:hypothetical protein
VCWKSCSSCWSFHLLQEEFLSAPIHSPLSGSPYRSFIKFMSVLGNEFFGKKGEKPSEEKPEPKENLKPKPKPKPFHCEHCGRDGHLAEFCFRRKREERLARELANKDRYRPSHGVPEPRLVPRGEGMVRTIYPQERREFVPRGEPPHREGGRRVGFGRGEFAGRSFARGQYEYGGNDRSFRSQRSYGPRSPLRGACSPPRGRVGVPPRSDRMDFANPTFEQWRGTGFIPFVLTPVLILFLTIALVFDFAGGRHGGLLVDRLWLLSTHDRRSTVVLQPHPGDDHGVHHFWG